MASSLGAARLPAAGLFLLMMIVPGSSPTLLRLGTEESETASDRLLTATDPSSSTSSAEADSSAVPFSSTVSSSSSVLFSLTKRFQLVCCTGGFPQPSHSDLVRNFSFQSIHSVDDHQQHSPIVGVQQCRLFKGSFLLPSPGLLSAELAYAVHIGCKCPDAELGHQLDAQCRRLPACLNNGFRSPLIDSRRCFCLDPFFGDRCEKVCDQGRRVRAPDGREQCSCAPFFRGDECREPICLNGGQLVNGGCLCPAQFDGHFCEKDGNWTRHHQQTNGVGARLHEFGTGTSRFHQRFSTGQAADQGGEMFTRDVSGTVFSLVMIVVLVLSMYLLMKHRMNVQNRYLSSRRADLLGACNFPPPPSMTAQHPHQSITNAAAGSAIPAVGRARRVELLPIGSDSSPSGRSFPPFVRSLAPFFGAGDGGPPPYVPPGQRTRRNRHEVLPPLPSYEDATKLPALRPVSIGQEDGDESAMELQEGQEQQQNQGETTEPTMALEMLREVREDEDRGTQRTGRGSLPQSAGREEREAACPWPDQYVQRNHAPPQTDCDTAVPSQTGEVPK